MIVLRDINKCWSIDIEQGHTQGPLKNLHWPFFFHLFFPSSTHPSSLLSPFLSKQEERMSRNLQFAARETPLHKCCGLQLCNYPTNVNDMLTFFNLMPYDRFHINSKVLYIESSECVLCVYVERVWYRDGGCWMRLRRLPDGRSWEPRLLPHLRLAEWHGLWSSEALSHVRTISRGAKWWLCPRFTTSVLLILHLFLSCLWKTVSDTVLHDFSVF